MTTKITYTCDKCGHTQTTDEQMWKVAVAVASFRRPPAIQNGSTKDWCRKCMEEYHLLSPVDTHPAKIPPPPTFEDLVRIIVQEEVNET